MKFSMNTVLIVALMGLAVLAVWFRMRSKDPVADVSPSPSVSATLSSSPTPSSSPAPVRTLEGGLQVQDLQVGTGAEAKSGMMVAVHYTGWLTNGTKFDSSLDRGQPYQFQLGSGVVIEGWDKGVVGMKVGGIRRLTIPPALGYGKDGYSGVIPPNATLVFEVQLLAVQ